MLIATFGATTGWAGKTITYENEAFVLEGYGAIQAADVMQYDSQGQLAWVNDGTRAWVGAKARNATHKSPANTAAPARPRTQSTADGADAAELLEVTPAGGTRPEATGDIAASAAAVDSTPWWRQKYVIPAAVGIVVAVLVLVAIAWTVKAQNDRKAVAREAAAKVVQPFRKLDSALDVGLNFSEYGILVRDAQFALDSYHPTDSTGQEVARRLSRAAEAYRAASEAWNDDIQDEFVTDAAYWNRLYPTLSLPAGFVTAESVRQAAWMVGSANVKQASTIVGP